MSPSTSSGTDPVAEPAEAPVRPVANWLALGRVAQLRRMTGNLQIALGELLGALSEIEEVLREPDAANDATLAALDELLVSGHEAAITLAVTADEVDTAWGGLGEAIDEGAEGGK